MSVRNLILVLGDQLNPQSAAFDGFDDQADAVLMIEAREEATYVRQHKMRLVFFFSAMRNFRDSQRENGRRVFYSELEEPHNRGSLSSEISRHIDEIAPHRIKALDPGDWRVANSLRKMNPPIEFCDDRDFLCSRTAFEEFYRAHSNPAMETFYRMMRRKLGILVDQNGKPIGGTWNFDSDNRAAFGRDGPPMHIRMKRFSPNSVTKEVIAMVQREFSDNPGKLDTFDLPVTRDQAVSALNDFIEHRLADFGRYEDAMFSREPFLFHSHLSGLLNLHLLTSREVIEKTLCSSGNVPLNSIEGFVRQVIGWREFVRGIYWREMPGYAALNALEADLPVPRFYWTGETDMFCLAESIRHTIDHAYAHHIERLMVLGLFCLLLGVRPYDVHLWHMSMFWDAIDWVSLPNALGMSQYGDGGVVATKPYVASGSYVNRMSDYCGHCRYDPRAATGERACPFTTLYWDFLARHERRFAKNPRMRQQYANLRRKDDGELKDIRAAARRIRTSTA